MCKKWNILLSFHNNLSNIGLINPYKFPTTFKDRQSKQTDLCNIKYHRENYKSLLFIIVIIISLSSTLSIDFLSHRRHDKQSGGAAARWGGGGTGRSRMKEWRELTN